MGFRKIILTGGIVAAVVFFAKCFKQQSAADPRGEVYAGSVTCVRCHQSISDSYAHTAHYLSTRTADEKSVAGSFAKDANELIINDSTRIIMEKRDSGLYQVVYIRNQETNIRRFDLVMGVVKGQTYLNWQPDGFHELPVSWFSTLHRWTGSPGYRFADLNVNRPVVKACFECHSSFAEGDPNILNVAGVQQRSWVFNIDCERCHGPAAAHVRFQEEHPEERHSKYMVSFQSISRARKVDLCAACHSGTKHISLKSGFGFKMGDSLLSYMIALPSAGEPLDVHGNQTQLLGSSKCFRLSSMDCTTCHNTHQNQRGFVKSFNDKCQGCHEGKKHSGEWANIATAVFIADNCTKCHMPAQPSTAIVLQAVQDSASIPVMVVNHRIAVYPLETARIMKQIN